MQAWYKNTLISLFTPAWLLGTRRDTVNTGSGVFAKLTESVIQKFYRYIVHAIAV